MQVTSFALLAALFTVGNTEVVVAPDAPPVTRIALPFQAPPDVLKSRKPSIKVLLTGATGKAWADNLTIRR